MEHMIFDSLIVSKLYLVLNNSMTRSNFLFESQFHAQKLTFEHGDGVFLKDGSGFLLAIETGAKNEQVSFPAWYHHGFCVENAARVKKTYEQMKTAGVEFAREYKEFGEDAANFYYWSPGPLKLEVSWNKDDEV